MLTDDQKRKLLQEIKEYDSSIEPVSLEELAEIEAGLGEVEPVPDDVMQRHANHINRLLINDLRAENERLRELATKACIVGITLDEHQQHIDALREYLKIEQNRTPDESF